MFTCLLCTFACAALLVRVCVHVFVNLRGKMLPLHYMHARTQTQCTVETIYVFGRPPHPPHWSMRMKLTVLGWTMAQQTQTTAASFHGKSQRTMVWCSQMARLQCPSRAISSQIFSLSLLCVCVCLCLVCGLRQYLECLSFLRKVLVYGQCWEGYF